MVQSIDSDTDNDGLTDGQEVNGFVYEGSLLKTNATCLIQIMMDSLME
jgi:hypothetical protein